MDQLYKIKVISDVDILFYVDENFYCEIEKNRYRFISLPKGEYVLDFVCKIEPTISKRAEICLEYDRILHIEFEKLLISAPSVIANMLLLPEKGEDGLYGYRDANTGILILPYQFESANHFDCWIKGDPNAYAEVVFNGKKRVINSKGEYIVDYDYDCVSPDIAFWSMFCECDPQYIHSFLVETPHRNYIINNQGEILGGFPKDVLINYNYFFSNGVLIYRACLWQFMGFDGKALVIANQIKDVFSWNCRAFFLLVERDDYWGICTYDNQEIIPCNNAELHCIEFEDSKVYLLFETFNSDARCAFEYSLHNENYLACLKKQVQIQPQGTWETIEEIHYLRNGSYLVYYERENGLN